LIDYLGCAPALDLAGGDEEKAQKPETTILTLFLSWKMGSSSFGEILRQVRWMQLEARDESR